MRVLRSLTLIAVLAALAAALVIPSGSAQAGFATCFKITAPVSETPWGDSYAAAGLYDWEEGTYIFDNFTRNESNSTIEYYIAVEDGQVAYAGSWDNYVNAWKDFQPWIWGDATVEAVPYDFCAGAIQDGRLNKTDLGALAYVYPTDDGYSVWELNLGDMEGYEKFAVSTSDISAAITAANESGVNQQLGESTERGTSLWALVGGQCQLNHFEQDGKLNEFVFACGA